MMKLECRGSKYKTVEFQLIWFGSVKRMEKTTLTRRLNEARGDKKRSQGRSKKTFQEEVRGTAVERGVKWEGRMKNCAR